VLKTSRFGRDNEPVRPTENIVVNNCILTSSSAAMLIGTETHADIRHVVFSNIIVRNANKVFGINVQDGATVSDVRFANVTFETNRRHWNWWGSAELMKFVLKKRTPQSRLGKIENITVDGVQGTARGTSRLSGQAESPLRNVSITNLRLKMLPDERPDKRASDAFIFQHVDGLTLRNLQIDWDRQKPEPNWRSALVLQEISNLSAEGLDVEGSRSDGSVPAIVETNVTRRPKRN
jgi:hypothetical protein